MPQLWATAYASEWFLNACRIQESWHRWIQESCHITKWFQESFHISKWFQQSCHSGFRNPVIGRFRNPATLVNGFRMPAELRTPATSKGNLFATTVKVWNTLTFVTSSSFLDVAALLPYTKWTLPHLRWSSYEEWHIHKLYYLGYERGRAKELLNLFGTVYTFSNSFALSKAKH